MAFGARAVKFRPTAKLNAGQVIDRRGLPNAGAPIDPVLKTLTMTNSRSKSSAVYVPGGQAFPTLTSGGLPTNKRDRVSQQLGIKRRKRPA